MAGIEIERYRDWEQGGIVSVTAVSLLVVVCGFVWGGFGIFLAYALYRERGKQRRPSRPSPKGENESVVGGDGG